MPINPNVPQTPPTATGNGRKKRRTAADVVTDPVGVGERRNQCVAKVWKDIDDGVMVPPIHYGKSARFPIQELNILDDAVAGGASKFELRELVAKLVAQREDRWKSIKADYGIIQN